LCPPLMRNHRNRYQNARGESRYIGARIQHNSSQSQLVLIPVGRSLNQRVGGSSPPRLATFSNNCRCQNSFYPMQRYPRVGVFSTPPPSPSCAFRPPELRACLQACNRNLSLSSYLWVWVSWIRFKRKVFALFSSRRRAGLRLRPARLM
jgi:hypothetical protein